MRVVGLVEKPEGTVPAQESAEVAPAQLEGTAGGSPEPEKKPAKRQARRREAGESGE